MENLDTAQPKLKLDDQTPMDFKSLSMDQLLDIQVKLREEIRMKSIKEEVNKVNKFKDLLTEQRSYINSIPAPHFFQFLNTFAPRHATSGCLDDSPHKDIVIGGCPCPRCTVLNFRQGTSEYTALTLGVLTKEKL